MLAPGIATERIDVRMLEQQQRVRNRAGFPRRYSVVLKPEAFSIIDETELFHLAEHFAGAD